MGIRDLFAKRQSQDETRGTSVLVCSLNSKFAELLEMDARTYSRYYASTTSKHFSHVRDLLKEIKKGYDVVHVLGDVSPAGFIADENGKLCPGAELITRCCDASVKLLWIASSNHGGGYNTGFKLQGQPLNLAMTIDRKGSAFSTFLDQLLSRMVEGETMPLAWVAIAPQTRNQPPDVPAIFFVAGRGAAKFK